MNGLTERINGILATALVKMVNRFPGTDWDLWLKWVLFCYRNRTQATTGYSPFELIFNRKPRTADQINEQVPFVGLSKNFIPTAEYVIAFEESLGEYAEAFFEG
jgi:hypothetical protein